MGAGAAGGVVMPGKLAARGRPRGPGPPFGRPGLRLGFRVHARPSGPVHLTDFLAPERVRIPVRAMDKAGVIGELVGLLVDRGGGTYRDVLAGVMEREAALSTGIGHGVAIPHGRSPSLPALSLVAGVTAHPVPFDAIDGEPVRLCFLVAGPEAAAGQHVKVLSRIARLVRRPEVRAALLAAKTPAEFCRAIGDAERH